MIYSLFVISVILVPALTGEGNFSSMLNFIMLLFNTQFSSILLVKYSCLEEMLLLFVVAKER